MDHPRDHAVCHVYIDEADVPMLGQPSSNIAAGALRAVMMIEAPSDIAATLRKGSWQRLKGRVTGLEQASTSEVQQALKAAAEQHSEYEDQGMIDFFVTVYLVLHGSLNKVIEWVRDEHEQHWLEVVPPFISANQSVGNVSSFFVRTETEISYDKEDWSRFDYPVIEVFGYVPKTEDLLSPDEWGAMILSTRDDPQLTLHLVSRARAAFDSRDYRTAIITMVTAVEREVARFVQREMYSKGVEWDDKVIDELSSKVGLKFLIETVASSLASDDGRRTALRALLPVNALRNKLIHAKKGEVPILTEVEIRIHLNACDEFLTAALRDDDVILKHPVNVASPST